MTQTDRLRALLDDGHEHSTPEILEKVYGVGHSGIARIGARIFDLKARLPDGWRIDTRRAGTITWYRMVKPPPAIDMFGVALVFVILLVPWILL